MKKRQNPITVESFLQNQAPYIRLTGFAPTGRNTADIGANLDSSTTGLIGVEVNDDGTMTITQPFQPVPKLPDSIRTLHVRLATHLASGIRAYVWEERLKSMKIVARVQILAANGTQLGICSISHSTQNLVRPVVAINDANLVIASVENSKRHRFDFLDVYCNKLALPNNPYYPNARSSTISPTFTNGHNVAAVTLSSQGIFTSVIRFMLTNAEAQLFIERRNLSNWQDTTIPQQNILNKNRRRLRPNCAIAPSDGAICVNVHNTANTNINDNAEMHTIGVDNTIQHPGNANTANNLRSFPFVEVYTCPVDQCAFVAFSKGNNGAFFVRKMNLNTNGHVTSREPVISLTAYTSGGSDHTKGHAFGVLPNGDVVDINIDLFNKLRALVYRNVTTPASRWPLDLSQATTASQSDAPTGVSITTSPTKVSNNNNPTKSQTVSPISLPTNTQQFTTQTILSMLGSSQISAVAETYTPSPASFDMIQTTGGSLPIPGANTPAGMSTEVIAGGIAAFFGLLYCVAVLIGVFYKLRGQNKDDISMNTLDHVLDGAGNESTNPATNPSTRISVYATSTDVPTQQTTEEGYDKFPTPPVIQYGQDEFASARNSAGPNQYKSMTNGVFTNQYDTVEQPLHTGETEKRPSQYDAAHDPLHTGETEMRRW